MTVLYGGAETVMVVRHPESGTIHHTLGPAYGGDTQCGRWIAGAEIERLDADVLVHMIDGEAILKARLCGSCWKEDWFEEAPCPKR